MLHESVISYLDRAASRSPAPGGGSVAALAGALGASMASMAANFTLGKKGYEEVQEEIKGILAESEDCRRKLAKLAVDDINAYEKVSAAYALPRETQQEKDLRKQKTASAVREALGVPLEAVDTVCRLMRILIRLAETGNKNLISDVGVAAYLCEAAIRSAQLNVEINLACMDDAKFVEAKRREVASLVKEAEDITAAVISKVSSCLRKS